MARLKNRGRAADCGDNTQLSSSKVELARQGRVRDISGQEVVVSDSQGLSSNLTLPSGAHDGIIERMTMDMVAPDPQNSRIFPVVRVTGEESYLHRCDSTKSTPVYILLDKGVIENHCPQNHPSFGVITKYVEDVKLLAGQIKQQGGLLQPIEVFKTGGCAASIVYGHMRYYSVVFNIGWESAWDFKVLKEKPANLKIRQFAENNLKSHLSSIEKLIGFQQAKVNLQNIFASQGRGEPKSEDYMISLGVKKSTYWRFSKIIQFPLLVDAMKAAIGHLELRNTLDLISKSEALEKESKQSIDSCISYIVIKYFEQNKTLQLPESLTAIKQVTLRLFESKPKEKAAAKAGRKPVSYNTPKVKSSLAIKTLLTTDVTQIDIDGVNWDDIDWNDKTMVNEALTATIKALEAKIIS